jgi:hypothetical protein
MLGHDGLIASFTQVEYMISGRIVIVWCEPQIPAKVNHKPEVKIGIVILYQIKPTNTILQKDEEWRVGLFFTNRTKNHLVNEERDAALDNIKRDGREGMRYSHLADIL